jgi:ParB/RepB/Spo0J family partition protein
MAKIKNGGAMRKISLAQIISTRNVREDYRDIDELAASIKTHGLLQPIAVKQLEENSDGIVEYELIAGHRRRLAFQALFEAGDNGFSMIDAVVVTGDKLTLQLVENLQRSDLTAREREQGICQMSKGGEVSQREIAALLGKTETYISRNINAYRIRVIAEENGIATSEISTNSLCEISAAADADIPALVQKLKDAGGTTSAARKIRHEYNDNAEPENTKTQEALTAEDDTSHASIEEPIEENEGIESETRDTQQIESGNTILSPEADTTNIEASEIQTIPRSELLETQKAPPMQRSATTRNKFNEFNPPHKKVDINDILLLLKEYISEVEKTLSGSEAAYKLDAANKIVALLHERL